MTDFQTQQNELMLALTAWRSANGIDIEKNLTEAQEELEKRFYVLYCLEHFSPLSSTIQLIQADESNRPYLEEFAAGARAQG